MSEMSLLLRKTRCFAALTALDCEHFRVLRRSCGSQVSKARRRERRLFKRRSRAQQFRFRNNALRIQAAAGNSTVSTPTPPAPPLRTRLGRPVSPPQRSICSDPLKGIKRRRLRRPLRAPLRTRCTVRVCTCGAARRTSQGCPALESFRSHRRRASDSARAELHKGMPLPTRCGYCCCSGCEDSG